MKSLYKVFQDEIKGLSGFSLITSVETNLHYMYIIMLKNNAIRHSK